MTRENIECMREVVLPFVKKKLQEINYENLGKSDAEEFEKHFNEILDLAIKALKQESCEDCCNGNQIEKAKLCQKSYLAGMEHKQESCEDCISRQAAIDALDKRFDSIPMEQTTEILLLRKDLRELPSVRPEKHTEERTETHACDCISRQAAIEVAKQYWYKPDIAGALAELPSVQPEPKTGHWIEHEHNGIVHIECSKCSSCFLKSHLVRNSYCPNCGYRMNPLNGITSEVQNESPV